MKALDTLFSWILEITKLLWLKFCYALLLHVIFILRFLFSKQQQRSRLHTQFSSKFSVYFYFTFNNNNFLTHHNNDLNLNPPQSHHTTMLCDAVEKLTKTLSFFHLKLNDRFYISDHNNCVCFVWRHSDYSPFITS
jgi:hypothetical protein